jgi:hypothetical protein
MKELIRAQYERDDGIERHDLSSLLVEHSDLDKANSLTCNLAGEYPQAPLVIIVITSE